MSVRSARELFVMLLSVARQNTQLSSKIYKEISQRSPGSRRKRSAGIADLDC